MCGGGGGGRTKSYLFFKKGIYLAARGQLAGSLVQYLNTVEACRTRFPDQGLNLGPLHWEHGILASGPPGKSPKSYLPG